jgi:tetratricopeptide (TPR) repeat protein
MDSARLTAQSFLPEVDIEHTEDDADSVMRKMLGVSDDAALDPGAGKRFQSDGSLGLCTVCGAFISQEAESCPVCGTHMEDMPDFVPSMDIVEPEQEEHGLAICPHCGVFVQEGATECMSCVKPIPEGATVPISEDIGLPEDDDKAARTLKTFLGVEKALEIAPVRDRSFTGLDLCPDCGAFVSMDAVVCSICGAPLFEDAEDMMDIDKRIGEIDSMKCPNCSTKLPVDSDGCSSCGLSFFAKPKEEDISAILNIELEQAMAETEPMAESAPTMPDVAASSPFDDDILDLLVSEEEGDSGPVSELTDAGLWDEPGLEVPYPETPSEVPEPESAIEEIAADEPLAPIEPIGSESIEFIQADSEVVETVDVLTEETLVEEAVAPASKPMAIREIDIDRQATTHAANWTTGVYISLATICFFLFFYAISPGIYAPGLAVIFISLLLWGIYLVFAERSLFFKGDLKHATPFIIGIIIGVLVLFQQPLGLFESAGLSGQPGLDRILLSVSVLLTVIGLVWIRARVRFVFTWLFGNLLLFLSTVVSSADASYGTGLESPVLLVAGFGTALIVMSLVFLQYERAISSSIETDVVRGDAHYLKRDYVRALASYDSALSKAQMKKVEVLASPIVQYDVPWYSKGSALIFMGEFEEGIKCLDMALAINPCNEVSWVNKGNAHSKLGQHDLATECYSKAIECNPFYEIAWNNLGNVHARRKDYLNALKHYNRAIKINPKYDDAWINKGYVLAKMGKREQAVKCLNHVGSRVKGKTQTVERDVHLL